MRPRHRFGTAFPLAIDVSDLRRDLYLLLACALSSKRFAEQTSGNDYDPLQNLRDAHEQALVGGLLLSIAIRVRALDDQAQIPSAVLRRSCGTLVIGREQTSLVLREACNKIVHAQKVQLTVSHLDGFDSTLPSPTSEHMEATMLLHGVKNRGTWRAALNLVAFVRTVIAAPGLHA